MDISQYEKMIHHFYNHMQKELGFDKQVQINFVSDEENQKNPLGKTAYYDPSNFLIVIYVDGRHIKDIFRSLSHELIHHKQNCDNQLYYATDENYAQTDPYLRKMEIEANSKGSMYFRDWEDNYKKSNSLLKEWIDILKKTKNRAILGKKNNKRTL